MLLWLGLVLLFASAVFGVALLRLGWPFELFASLLPQIGALALLYALPTLVLGRPGIALCSLATGLLCAYGARELFAPADAPIPERQLRIV